MFICIFKKKNYQYNYVEYVISCMYHLSNKYGYFVFLIQFYVSIGNFIWNKWKNVSTFKNLFYLNLCLFMGQKNIFLHWQPLKKYIKKKN